MTASPSASLFRAKTGESLPLSEPVLRIGRDPSCVVQVADRHASRVHAEIRHAGDEYVLHDLSANGTWVNGVRVEQQRTLASRDRIRIAGERFVFMIGAESKPPSEAPASPWASTAGVEVIRAPRAPEVESEWTASPPRVEEHPAYFWIRMGLVVLLGVGFLLLLLHWIF